MDFTLTPTKDLLGGCPVWVGAFTVYHKQTVIPINRSLMTELKEKTKARKYIGCKS
jgi:hypothetical protein